MNHPANPPLPPDSCSLGWGGLSAFGTAPQASFWVALEQPGPWGRDAFTQSHLDPDLGARIEAAAAAHGGRAILIRRPGQHADSHGGPRRVFVAGGLAGAAWLLSGEVDDPAEVLTLPWEHLAQTRPVEAPWLHPADPVLLVCTNAKRDRCCALVGRPIVEALAERDLRVWECSHTSGHRFAPTGVLLPYGQVLARLTPTLGVEVLEAAASGKLAVGTLNEQHDRSVSWLPPREGAAVSWVRAREAFTDPIGLAAVADGDSVTVTRVDGQIWELTVTRQESEPRAESCGKDAKPAAVFHVELLSAVYA
ncbi:sucrase ferredoxin [Propioniciclava coleopterorum]|uniref:Sucrase ferredoxin n=1 Tax=Propioniciclava coleopterorum TaxID=2714937 RepID=A0A6G7Y4A5_9ACTN|nr:sucrase ferredoxin [Propioniciclava coleopterorum]QIK71447.1 sucrase ferredoxin [Propioniciclava coleopterorum]